MVWVLAQGDRATDTATEDPCFAYWKDFARLYLSLFAATPELEKRDLTTNPVQVDLPKDDLSRLLLTIPPMKGSEYLSEVGYWVPFQYLYEWILSHK